jgi:hypothetical protein
MVISRADSAGFESFSFCSFTVGTCMDAFVGCLLDLLCIYAHILGDKVVVREIRGSIHIHTFSYVHSGIHTDAAPSISDQSSFQPDYLLTTLIVVLFIDFQHTFKQVCVLLLFLCLCVCVCVWTAVRHGQCSIGWIPHVFPFSARHPCTGIFFSIKRLETIIQYST